jgi:hypothetical protein
MLYSILEFMEATSPRQGAGVLGGGGQEEALRFWGILEVPGWKSCMSEKTLQPEPLKRLSEGTTEIPICDRRSPSPAGKACTICTTSADTLAKSWSQSQGSK